MEKKILKRSIFFTLITLLVLVLLLTAGTYAWFSSNSKVSTDRVEARTGSTDARLLLSSKGGSAFSGSSEASINQLNKSDLMQLLPVSTDDLENFVFQTVNTAEASYILDKDEERYYHGNIYLKAEAEGIAENSRLAVYFDGDKLSEMLNPDKGSLINNAARLGIKINGREPLIFALSSEENSAKDQVSNTYLDGKLLKDGNVLHSDSLGKVKAVSDPAEELKAYSSSEAKAKPLAVLDFGKVYEMEVYLYLEGCDPDCSDIISADASDIYLAFYGMIVE